jgi:hypothetical protein
VYDLALLDERRTLSTACSSTSARYAVLLGRDVTLGDARDVEQVVDDPS